MIRHYLKWGSESSFLVIVAHGSTRQDKIMSLRTIPGLNESMNCSVIGIGSDIPAVFLDLNRATVFLPALFMILPTYEGKQR